LLKEGGTRVVLLDSFNDYYDQRLKLRNVQGLLSLAGQPGLCCLEHVDIRNEAALHRIMQKYAPIAGMIHLAARAGVRPSIQQPALYQAVNVLGTQRIFNACLAVGVPHILYASSSSVYGAKAAGPFEESWMLSPPESPYAATKVENEAEARRRAAEHPTTNFVGFRFFTVDGPYPVEGLPPGRPDMAVATFIRSLLGPIQPSTALTLYGDGSYRRDFTYVDDIVSGILGALTTASDGRLPTNCEVYNLGEEDTTSVARVVLMLAQECGLLSPAYRWRNLKEDVTEEECAVMMQELMATGRVISVPAPPGDVPLTHASIEKAKRELAYRPHTQIAANLRRAVLAALIAEEEGGGAEGQDAALLQDGVRYLSLHEAVDGFDDSGECVERALSPSEMAECQAMLERCEQSRAMGNPDPLLEWLTHNVAALMQKRVSE